MVLEENDLKVISDLRRKRGVVKSSLTRVRKFVGKFKLGIDAITLLEFRQEELPQINRKFDEIQCQIELLDTENAELVEQDREEFENEYFSIRSEIQELINAEKSQNSSMRDSMSNTVVTQRARLAPLALPIFSGDIQEWESYFDCFKAMVHNDDVYPLAQKFSYLRSSLTGSALDIIKAIPMTDANYTVAIKRLQQRYENKSMVIQSHIRAILDCPHVELASAVELQALHSNVVSHIAALEALGQPIEHWDAWLVTILLRKLDTTTSHEWQLRRKNNELPKFKELEEFLASRCIAFESSETRIGNRNEIKKKLNNSNLGKRLTLAATQVKSDNCPCCSQTHKIYACKKFKELTQSDRFNVVRDARLCFNCLSPYHIAPNCQSNSVCLRCKGKHNTLLHFDKLKQVVSSEQFNSNIAQEDNPTASALLNNQTSPSHSYIAAKSASNHVFLSTAVVLVTDSRGCKHNCRAVLDNGSMMNFISKNFLNILQLPVKKTELPVRGIGASRVQSVAIVEIHVDSKMKNYKQNLSCYVLPTIVSKLPSCTVPSNGWNIPDELWSDLADPKFNESSSIDLLIGAGTFYESMEVERIPLNIGSLSLQNTKFGWIVTGVLGTTCLLGVNSLGESIEDDWKAVHVDKKIYGQGSRANQKCAEEEEALRHFQNSVKRNEEGRFVLRLPIKPEVRNLGESLIMATSRFINVERRLQRDKPLRIEYNKFMKEYIDMGHMRELSSEEKISPHACYLPHHPVFKASSITTKTRVVFDASARTSSGMSLNDVLMRGPTVQDDIFSILARFRKHQYVITADIEKMFRQIMVAEEDCHLQRILWRFDPSEALRTFTLTTVTYGTTPASFMATQCLITLAEEMRETNLKASKVIQRDFYMDDLITGAETEEECIRLQKDITDILETAKMPLRKWCSNSPLIVANINKNRNDPLFTLDLGDDDVIKSLGLCWQPYADKFKFNVTIPSDRTNLTKRKLLSDLNKVFDPLGFLGPVLIKGKIFLQQLWQLKIDWDEQLEANIQEKWKSYYSGLELLKEIFIPRKCKPYPSEAVEVHGFCDASMEAYGACIYIRSLDQQGKWHSQLLCSRTRVAPLKGATIPRLELSGALLLAQLAAKVADSWSTECKDFRLWTDSTIVLGWLNSHSSRLKTFVANRVGQILEITKTQQWNHVKTNENPADVLSRGIVTQQLQEASIWWYGPHWLSKDSSSWKRNSVEMPEQSLPELKQKLLTLAVIEHKSLLLDSYSEWSKLVRAIAWLSKFIKYLRTKKSMDNITRHLTVSEIKDAEYMLVKQAQRDEFSKDYDALSKNKELPRRSKLRALCPFIDKKNLIVVGGRLHNSNVADHQKHPIVLPYNHKVTRLIFEYYHKRLLHGGPQLLLTEIRLRFWPLKGRVLARSVTHQCVTCVRAKPKFENPIMATLPKARVQPSRPFTVTGVDFAGPIAIRSGIRRVTSTKSWIAVFVCLSTRAIHLEPVIGLTSGAFLAALRRFMARRGKCAKIYSDNATNFVGVQRELTTYLKGNDISLAQEGIEWHFNPPSTPHFGGIWESAVKSAKFHLTRIVKEARLSLEELTTLLCQVEACLNSRPLTPLSSSPLDLETLTPAHFLIGGPLTLPPEPDLIHEDIHTLRRWKYVQALMQTFWSRWSKEYLPQLQIRGRWLAKTEQMKVGDVVIIKEDFTPPGKWKLGLITKIHPGSDGTVRVVTLKIANGNEMKRPVVKLCRLPVDSETKTVEK